MAARHIVIIQGHPDPDPARLCRGLAGAYAQAAHQAGHYITHVDVSTLDVPILRSRAAFDHGPVPDGLCTAVAAIRAAHHVVIVFPLWLGTMPALLKAFMEQVFRPDIAFARQDHGIPSPLLVGRSARLVVTMTRPALAYRWWHGAHGVRGLERNILNFAGFSPVHRTLIGRVDRAPDDRRQAWLDTLADLGRAGR